MGEIASLIQVPEVHRSEDTSAALISNRVLRALAPADRRVLLAELEQVALSAGQSLYAGNGRIEYVYFPEECVIALVPTQFDGPPVGITLIGNEGIAGLEALIGGSHAFYRPVVEVAGHALRIRTAALEQLMDRSESMRQVLRQYTWTLLASISRLGVCCGRHSLEQRLCTWLLMVRDRMRTNDIPLTHEAISRRLGLRRAGITVATGKLHRDHIIRHSRGHIVLVDRKAVEAGACSCYSVLQQLAEQPLVPHP